MEDTYTTRGDGTTARDREDILDREEEGLVKVTYITISSPQLYA